MRAVVAVDPGPTTGLAFWSSDVVLTVELPAWRAVALAKNFCSFYAPVGGVVLSVEEYRSGQIALASDGTVALEVIGALRWEAIVNRAEFESRPSADAMNFCPNEKLRDLGWWIRGRRHARDALRHLCLTLEAHGVVPSGEVEWIAQSEVDLAIGHYFPRDSHRTVEAL